ncbi:hypothetical protein AB1Y20_015257 [Prymnesium parvum]|uniref:Uncharacterized protein n=1 Tax=Prymnesium parvum TaxID=97485 RepID=A0AB34JXW4_PRYPA
MGCGCSKKKSAPPEEQGLLAQAERIREQNLAEAARKRREEEARAAAQPAAEKSADLISYSDEPPPLTTLVDTGCVIPDEAKGPYDLGAYHSNTSGAHRGFQTEAGMQTWFRENQAALGAHTSWASIDFEAVGAVDPDWMLGYGRVGGKGANLKAIRPKVIAAQKAMCEAYARVYTSTRAEQQDACDRVEALPEKRQKVVQRGGPSLLVTDLYKGALCSLPELWRFGHDAIAASGESGVEVVWGIKRPLRLWTKVQMKYEGDMCQVTDCARLSLAFATVDGLERAGRYALEAAACCTLKNRTAHPTSEGYRDLLFTVALQDEYVCEVQMHLAPLLHARPAGAGARMHKICRRVLAGPVVRSDTYCLAIEDGSPTGEGERNDAGERDGMGTMVFASGDMYVGQWKADRMEGEGTYYFAISTGSKYVGQWKADKMDGQGTYYFADGSTYVGNFKEGMMDGEGTHFFADGNKYVGGYSRDKKHGRGTYTYANGDNFTGEYFEGQKNGEASYYFAASGTTFVGRYKADRRDGGGTYLYQDGTVEVSDHMGGEKHGEGVKWSVDRATAWRLQRGVVGEEISLEEAAGIAERIGRPVPEKTLSAEPEESPSASSPVPEPA